MQKADRDRLSTPLPSGEAHVAEQAFSRALGIESAELTQLHRAIARDLDRVQHGIGWWTPFGEEQRRILASDHVITAAESINTNLQEAVLHHWERRDAWVEVEQRYARVRRSDGTIELLPFRTPADVLPDAMSELHLAGFFRALGSVLDCLAAVTIGVLAVPQDLLKADFRSVCSWLESSRNKKDRRHPIHADFSITLQATIRAAGPGEWLNWVDDYRNMMVHRGRRKQIRKLVDDAHLLDAQGQPITRTTPIFLLLREPAVSDVEAVLQYEQDHLTLSEPAETTMTELVTSCVFLVNEVSKTLLNIWSKRRAEPTLLIQPLSKQWPRLETVPSQGFRGYQPNSVNVGFATMLTSTEDGARLHASGIRTEERDSVWSGQKKPDGNR